MLASIEEAIPAWTVTDVLSTTAAIAIVLAVQPAIAISFQRILLSFANHRKVIQATNRRLPKALEINSKHGR